MAQRVLTVAMMGTLPPLRGISAYCSELALSVAAVQDVHVEFISFAALYPRLLYPGGASEDESFEMAESLNLNHRRRLRWYNPISWIVEGITVKADVLHVQWWSWVLAPVFLTVMLLFRLRRVPIMLTLHNLVPHEPSWIKRWLYRSVIRIATHYVVHSARNVTQMNEEYGITIDRATQIPHGILQVPKPHANARDSLRNRLGINEHQIVILFFGAIRPYKGIDILIDGFARVTQTRPACVLLVAGKPWVPWERYQRRIDDLGLSDRVFSCTDYIGDVPTAVEIRRRLG